MIEQKNINSTGFRDPVKFFKFILVALLPVGFSGNLVAQVLFQPDSATTSSQFSSSYSVGRSINGSGLPPGFGPDDEHAIYAANNHWTTAGNTAAGAHATYFFDNAVTIGTFYMWNHLSDGVASNAHYAVTRFDLELFDAGGNLLREYRNLEAQIGIRKAQGYGFDPVSGVRSVKFTIISYRALDIGFTGTHYSGLAEVAFAAEQLEIADPPAAYLDWVELNGMDPEGNGDPFADADLDGLANIIEYALDSPPLSGTAANLPISGVRNGNLEFSYTIRRSLGTAFSDKVEYSTDLLVWNTASASMVNRFTISGRGQVVTVTIPLPANESRLFARLRITDER